MQVAVSGTTDIKFTVSIGVAVALNDDFHDLLRRADGALYAAKAGGRNRVASAV
jgi:diguanylate cyclase (GGDEF)-like protein